MIIDLSVHVKKKKSEIISVTDSFSVLYLLKKELCSEYGLGF